MTILTSDELKTLRDIGNKIDTDKANEAIQLAESVDLYNIIGNLYFDIVENVLAPAYADLIDGSTFTVNGKNFIQSGVKALIADLAYARYSTMINNNFTPFGMTVKTTQDSVPVSDDRLQQIVLQAKRDADAKFSLIDLYLNQNKTTFSRYFETEDDCNKPDLVNGRQNWSII